MGEKKFKYSYGMSRNNFFWPKFLPQTPYVLTLEKKQVFSIGFYD
jgi:hypothetical protein